MSDYRDTAPPTFRDVIRSAVLILLALGVVRFLWRLRAP